MGKIHEDPSAQSIGDRFEPTRNRALRFQPFSDGLLRKAQGDSHSHGAQEIEEDALLEALKRAHSEIVPTIDVQEDLQKRVGVPKIQMPEPLDGTSGKRRLDVRSLFAWAAGSTASWKRVISAGLA